MPQAVLTFDGREAVYGSALLCHNERLADSLDPAARDVAEISKKRNKTEADHLELARREFIGGLYLGDNGPMVPAMNMLRCIEGGARRLKRGKDVNRGLVPLDEYADLDYEGPRDPDELWKQGFWLRKGVGVGTKRVTRTRPCFKNWKLVLPVEVDANIWDPHTLQDVCDQAGKYEGLGDMRPIHGKALITVTPIDEWLSMPDGDLSAVGLARKTRIQQIRDEDEARNGRHLVAKVKAKVGANGRG